jgi:hypothetical protein
MDGPTVQVLAKLRGDAQQAQPVQQPAPVKLAQGA